MSQQILRNGVAASLALLLVLAGAVEAQEGSIQGVVLDAAGERPLAATQVHIPELGIGSLTDQNGRFQLSGVPAGTREIRVERLGYAPVTQEVEVAAGESIEIDFRLRGQALALEEMVVTGTAGQARRREVGNTVSSISVGDLNEPVTSVDAILQGRTAGATIQTGSGVMGGGAAIRLRGNTSVSMSNHPIVFIDGVRARSEMYPINRSEAMHWINSANETPSPLNDLNPNDIERIEIVKGAAATTLYGTEAAGGVIQIFTKRGAEGAATWTGQTNQTFSSIRPFGPSTDPYIRMDPFLKTGHNQHYSLSVSGGATGFQYFLSGLAETGTGTLPNDSQDKYGLRGNFTFTPWDRVQLQWTTSFQNHEFRQTPTGQSSRAITYNAMRYPNSPMAGNLDEVFEYLIDNANSRFTTGFTLNLTPTENFTHRLSYGYDRATSNTSQTLPFGHNREPRGEIAQGEWTAETISLDYAGTWDVRLSPDFRTSLSWGAQSVTDHERNLQGYGTGFPGPGEHTLSSAGNPQTFQNSMRVINAGLFVQNLFDFRDRYFLTVGMRVDGNSAFGEDLDLQPYPKVSGSWVVSDEAFYPEGFGELKLRAAYGHAGRAPGAFDAVRTWQPEVFGGQSAFWPANVGNPNLGPERTKELEFGFDGSFLDDRLTVEFTHFRQTTTDALFQARQIPSLGFSSSQLENVGEISSRGIELMATGQIYQSPSVRWELGGSVSTLQSNVEDMGGVPEFGLGFGQGRVTQGQPVPVIRGIKVTNANEFAEPEYETNHFFGPNYPTLTLGLNTSLDLPRGITVSALGEFMGGHYMQDEASTSMVNRGSGSATCQRAYDHVPFDTYPQGNLDQVDALHRARCYTVNSVNQLWIYPADFLRMRELSLGLPIPFDVPGAQSARFTMSARNFWTWTNEDFWDFDPEMAGYDGADTSTRFISEQIPAPATFTLSLRMVF